jgi:hypothetical protein
MSLVILEGFESYGSAAGADLITELAQKWGIHNMASDWAQLVDGFNSGSALMWNADESSAGLMLPIDSTDTACIGFAVKPGSPASYVNQMLLRILSGLLVQAAFELLPTGYIVYNRGSIEVDITSEPLTMGTWTYVELKVYINNTVGTVDVHFNGESVMSFSGDTRPATSVTMNELQIHPIKFYAWDNIYVYDDVDGTPSMLGPIVIEQLLPTGDDTHEWTPSTGATGYEVVDNLEIEDTTYVSDDAVNATELWAYSDLSEIDGSIVAVQQHTRVATDAGGLRTVDILCESGVTTDSTSYGMASDGMFDVLKVIYETDPNTSSAWTVSNLNAANFGVKVGD